MARDGLPVALLLCRFRVASVPALGSPGTVPSRSAEPSKTRSECVGGSGRHAVSSGIGGGDAGICSDTGVWNQRVFALAGAGGALQGRAAGPAKAAIGQTDLGVGRAHVTFAAGGGISAGSEAAGVAVLEGEAIGA